MSEKVPNEVIDVTNVELTPGDFAAYLDNGKNGFECCCDECDYFLLCFPEFEPQPPNEEENDDNTINN